MDRVEKETESMNGYRLVGQWERERRRDSGSVTAHSIRVDQSVRVCTSIHGAFIRSLPQYSRRIVGRGSYSPTRVCVCVIGSLLNRQCQNAKTMDRFRLESLECVMVGRNRRRECVSETNDRVIKSTPTRERDMAPFERQEREKTNESMREGAIPNTETRAVEQESDSRPTLLYSHNYHKPTNQSSFILQPTILLPSKYLYTNVHIHVPFCVSWPIGRPNNTRWWFFPHHPCHRQRPIARRFDRKYFSRRVPANPHRRHPWLCRS